MLSTLKHQLNRGTHNIQVQDICCLHKNDFIDNVFGTKSINYVSEVKTWMNDLFIPSSLTTSCKHPYALLWSITFHSHTYYIFVYQYQLQGLIVISHWKLIILKFICIQQKGIYITSLFCIILPKVLLVMTVPNNIIS